MPEHAPNVPWLVRRDRINPRFPWFWVCNASITTGPLTKACGACGPASTETAAERAATTHARERHGYTPADDTGSATGGETS